MKDRIDLAELLGGMDQENSRRLELFALINLGLVESLADGVLSAADVIRTFYNAKNCQFVRRRLRNATADKIMSHGVQLQDLFEVLSDRESQQEFQRELTTIRALSMQLLEHSALVASK